MPPPRRPRKPKRPTGGGPLRRHRAATTTVAGPRLVPERVPKRWVKFFVGIFLLPPAWVLTKAFFLAFARTTVHDGFWISEEFWFFSLGVLVWAGVFAGLPKFVRLYVFGHELTHALWVWMMGGRVHRFEVRADGGLILADKTNTWIALAPYFFPIYSVIALAAFGVAGLFTDMTPYRLWLYGVLGATWAFHFTFTCWMIPKGQPDLAYGGTFFSLVVIYIINLAILAVLLVIASPGVTWTGFAHDLVRHAADFSQTVVHLYSRLVVPGP